MSTHVTLQNWTDLTPIQLEIVNHLAAGATITAAAGQSFVSRVTIYDWLHNSSAFRTAFDAARAEYAATLRDDLHTLGAKALHRLHQLLDDPQTPPNVLLRTITLVLNRPQLPHTGWNLPTPTGTPEENQALQDLGAVETDYQLARKTSVVDKAGEPLHPAPSPAAPESVQLASTPPIPRNSPCPCHSGLKYKRCCGRNAPPVLGSKNAAEPV